MAQKPLDIDLIYGRVLVRLGFRTQARKAYVQKLVDKHLAAPTLKTLKKLFLLTRMLNGDMSQSDLGKLCKDPESMCAFAWTILKRPYPEGEAVIAQSKEYAYTYAKFVLKLPEDQAKAWTAK